MGFIKFLFQIAFGLFAFVAGLFILMLMLDSSNPWIQIPAGLITFILIVGIGGWKLWLILFGVYKGKEAIKSYKEEAEQIQKAERQAELRARYFADDSLNSRINRRGDRSK